MEGNKVVCHTATFLEVRVRRDGHIWYQRFESDDEGARPVTEVEDTGTYTGDTGTEIIYQPDPKVYGDIFIDIPSLEKMLRELSYFTKGLKIYFIADDYGTTIYSKNGLVDGLNSENSLSRPFSYFYETDDCKVELALQWVSSKGNIKGYANGLYMPDGGAFISGFKSSLTRTFNSLSKGNFSGDQIRNVLDGFVSVKVKVGQFSNQAKTALANPEARTATSSAITNALKDFALRRKADFDKVVELLTKVEKAEKAAERARQQVMGAVKDIERNQKKKVFSTDKLKDSEKLGQDSILLIAEGDSALGSLAQGRDYTKYGIMAIRGKILNCLSHPDEKIFQNEEIKLLLSALNITPGKYDPKKLRYGKLAICTDADSDGYHIGLLIMAAIRHLAPQFLQEGRLCWLRSPLYIVKNKGKEEYYFTDEEFNKVRGKTKGEVTRAKGLGELSPETCHKSMFTPEYQRLEVIQPSEEGIYLLENLMGVSVEPRTEYVFKNIDFSEIRE